MTVLPIAVLIVFGPALKTLFENPPRLPCPECNGIR